MKVILGVIVIACYLAFNAAAGDSDTAAGNTSMQLIDKFGNAVVLPVETLEIRGFSKEGLSAVRLVNGETAVIDNTGKVVFNTGRDGLTAFENGLSVFQDSVSYLWGAYSSSGAKVVEAKYHWISPFCDGYAIATRRKDDDVILVLRRDGSTVAQIDKASIVHDYLPPCEKLIPFRDRETNLRGFIDFESKIAVPAKFKEVAPFRENLARVLVQSGNGLKVGFIDSEGEFSIEPRFPIDSGLVAESTNFSEGIAFVPSDTTFGMKVAINATGEEIFKVNAFSIEPFVDGRAAFFDRDAEKWGYLDNQGRTTIRPIYTSASSFGGGLAVVSKKRLSWRLE